MRNLRNRSLVHIHIIESHNVQSKIDIFQLTDADIQRDFLELWMNIQESINIYEMDHGKIKIKNKSDKNSAIINLN